MGRLLLLLFLTGSSSLAGIVATKSTPPIAGFCTYPCGMITCSCDQICKGRTTILNTTNYCEDKK